MIKNSLQARIFVNPAAKMTEGSGLGYGVFKTEGLTLVEKCQGIKCHDVLHAIKEGDPGDVDVLREFETKEAGKKKRRSFTFRRTAIPRHLRERLNEGI